jgi:hypothetical protein
MPVQIDELDLQVSSGGPAPAAGAQAQPLLPNLAERWRAAWLARLAQEQQQRLSSLDADDAR